MDSFRFAAIIIVLNMSTAQGMHWVYGLLGAPYAFLGQREECVPEAITINGDPCAGRLIRQSDTARLVQLNVANQFGRDGGGGLSCAYHSLKNNELIVQKFLTGYPENLSEALNSRDIIKERFGRGDPEHMGTWRQRIFFSRSLLPIRQSLLRAFEYKMPNSERLRSLDSNNPLDKQGALSVHGGFKKMIRNYADTLAASLFINQGVYAISTRDHLRHALTPPSCYDASGGEIKNTDGDIQNAIEYVRTMGPTDTYESLFWNVEDARVDTSTLENIDTENLTKEELAWLVKQEFSDRGRFFVTIDAHGIPDERLFAVRKPILLDGLNVLSESFYSLDDEEDADQKALKKDMNDELYTQKAILLKKIGKIRKRVQEDGEIQAVLLGSMSHAIGADGENNDGHWIGCVMKDKDCFFTNSANDEPVEYCAATKAFIDALTSA